MTLCPYLIPTGLGDLIDESHTYLCLRRTSNYYTNILCSLRVWGPGPRRVPTYVFVPGRHEHSGGPYDEGSLSCRGPVGTGPL